MKDTPNLISHLCRHDQSPSIRKCPCNGEPGTGTAARLWPSSPLIRITVDYGASCFGEEVQEPSWKAEGTNTSEQPQRPRDSSRPIVLDSPRLPRHTGRTSNATQVLPKVPGTIYQGLGRSKRSEAGQERLLPALMGGKSLPGC